jgi:hypothetical protein
VSQAVRGRGRGRGGGFLRRVREGKEREGEKEGKWMVFSV